MSCAICLDDNSQKEFYVTICNHIFHKECILKTKVLNDSVAVYKSDFTLIQCPLCRKNLSMYNLNYKIFYSGILENTIYNELLSIYSKIKDSHLNTNYTFIGGGYAVALYNKLTNKNTKYNFNDVDIYYIDYDNLYENNIIERYNTETGCKFKTPFLKSIKKQIIKLNNKVFETDILYIKKSTYVNKIEDSIMSVFNNTDLSCCKVAFTLTDNIIKFYIHSDYYKNTAHICNYSLKKTKKRITKYQERGYNFDYFTYCCNKN